LRSASKIMIRAGPRIIPNTPNNWKPMYILINADRALMPRLAPIILGSMILRINYLIPKREGSPFSVKIVRKEGEKEEMRSTEEKGLRLFPHFYNSSKPLAVVTLAYVRDLPSKKSVFV